MPLLMKIAKKKNVMYAEIMPKSKKKKRLQKKTQQLWNTNLGDLHKAFRFF